MYATANTLITVKNVLQIEGQPLLPVEFTVNSTSTSAYQWRGLHFTTGNAPYNPAVTGEDRGSFVQHAVLRYTGRSSHPSILVDGSFPLIEDVHLDTIGIEGIDVTNTVQHFTITRLTVTGAEGRGVRVRSGAQCRLQPCIVQDSSFRTSNYGVTVERVNDEGSVIVQNSHFEGPGVSQSSGLASATVHVRNSSFNGLGSANYGVYSYAFRTNVTDCRFTNYRTWAMYTYASSGEPSYIANNRFYDAANALQVLGRSLQSYTAVVVNNRFERISNVAFDLRPCSAASRDVWVEGNLVTDSNASSSIVDGCAYTGQELIVANNEFRSTNAKENGHVSQRQAHLCEHLIRALCGSLLPHFFELQ